jgi:hypothetical protein
VQLHSLEEGGTLIKRYFDAMDEFELVIEYRNEQITFPGKLLLMGYTHKIQVEVHGVQVLFEPDEERHYRAVIAEDHRDKINVAILEKIAASIEAALK